MRAWIFSENGHPFVRIRGHFPCQGNNPPLQRGAESTPPTLVLHFMCRERHCPFRKIKEKFAGGRVDRPYKRARNARPYGWMDNPQFVILNAVKNLI